MDHQKVERACDGPASLKHKGVCNVRAGRGCFSSDDTCDKWHFSYYFDWTWIFSYYFDWTWIPILLLLYMRSTTICTKCEIEYNYIWGVQLYVLNVRLSTTICTNVRLSTNTKYSPNNNMKETRIGSTDKQVLFISNKKYKERAGTSSVYMLWYCNINQILTWDLYIYDMRVWNISIGFETSMCLDRHAQHATLIGD